VNWTSPRSRLSALKWAVSRGMHVGSIRTSTSRVAVSELALSNSKAYPLTSFFDRIQEKRHLMVDESVAHESVSAC
jgi:hypothetical protein